jgi:cytochrome c oxidase cbb3-type subunit 3
MHATRYVTLTVLAFAAIVSACNGGKRHTSDAELKAELPSEGLLASIPLGDLAGPSESLLRGEIHNPYAHQEAAITEGKSLFHSMNCVACHGYGARGGMCPDLTDKAWRYGGTPAEIYKSIAEGRPKGMPAWGQMLPPETIWKITAYIESLGGATTPSQALAGSDGWAAEMPKGRRFYEN